jgi:hypothetical protein
MGTSGGEDQSTENSSAALGVERLTCYGKGIQDDESEPSEPSSINNLGTLLKRSDQ